MRRSAAASSNANATANSNAGNHTVRACSSRTVTLLNIFLFSASLYLYLLSRYPGNVDIKKKDTATASGFGIADTSTAIAVPAPVPASVYTSSYQDSTPSADIDSQQQQQQQQQQQHLSLPACEDPVWCSIPMPKISHFRFDPPTDANRWKQAQVQASRGEQVLLRRIVKTFPSSYDFLDGDIGFRRMHYAFDFFVDDRRDLSPLLPPTTTTATATTTTTATTATSSSDVMRRNSKERGRRLKMEGNESPSNSMNIKHFPTTTATTTTAAAAASTTKTTFDTTTAAPVTTDTMATTAVLTSSTADDLNEIDHSHNNRRSLQNTVITGPKLVNGKLYYPWELEKKRVIPDPYDFHAANRSAVVSVGYTAYTRDSNSYFTGNRIGAAYIDRSKFFQYWREVKNKIDSPFVAVCIGNENWGMLSTMFPNRTAGWGRCCDTAKTAVVWDFLNHEKTLMLVTNQHLNVSHPKLLVMPRGLPLTWGFTRFIVWDAMRNTLKYVRKQKLLFAAASNWGPRPQILRCISDKVPAAYFDGHVRTPKTNRLSRELYYQKLGSAMFGVGLPGLGYDTFRAWELMTMGTIVVLERAVGFDRSMYRLPALLLEDFDLITPELLREAYLEALYRADDFEYERLTQNFWYGVIANVSATMSVQTILDKFPMSAEEPNFARPREPYECGKTNSCGKGTKRTPRSSC